VKEMDVDNDGIECRRYTLEDFQKVCKFGGMCDSDGIGFYGDAQTSSELPVSCVTAASGQLDPKMGTHVWWYNK
jgi:hypothetical protein